MSAAVVHGNLEESGEMVVHAADVFLLRKLVGYALLEFGVVAAVIEHHGIRLHPVAPGTSRFLEVSLERAGAVEVYHHAHVRLVYAHAEGVCSHHDALHVVVPQFLPLVLH